MTTTTTSEQSHNMARRPTLTRTYELYTEQELIDAWESGALPPLDAISCIRFETIGEGTPKEYEYHASRWAFVYSNGHLYITSECRHDYLEGVRWDDEAQCYLLGESYRTKANRICLRFLFAAMEVDEHQQGELNA